MINIADILKDIPIYERRFWSPVGLKIGKLSVIKEVRLKNSTTHGLANKHPLYGVWKSIKSRCLITTSVAYKDYGGRGITICEEWRDNFKAFFDWCISHG